MAELLRLLTTSFDDEDTILRQVIVNTHSPILIKCLTNETNDDTEEGVSIWFSRMVSRKVQQGGKAIHLRVSKITPLTKSFQLSFTTEENKMTVADAMEYLKLENRDL